ncbi:non-structural maintenance of chromosomes element 1 homolog [Phtheirospermum japonicum]|uniref:Non-structural maintenance of chromosomes element 1 homolog n=1 Tax=Phtheirospermum japonicum TaxID=374723 RepID=A0A830B4S1_9LAMI|nr:non-structural maintenance of chromosomes element 1 homolog [Phtheirospermum japonicum]
MSSLSWRHQTLIQALLSRGPLKEDDFRSIFSQVIGKSSGSQQQLFDDYLRKINTELGYVQLELRACRNQYNGSVYYGVVNNVSDDQSKLGTKYTVPQIAYYKGIVEAIIQDAEASGCISNIDALNIRLETQIQGMTDSESQGCPSQIPPAFKNFSMSQKEKTLELFLKDQWLSSVPDEKIGIGVRSFLDLRSWFRSNEVPICEVCNEAAVKAQLCKNEACNVRLHQYCLEKKFSQRRVERVCPGCGTQWPGSTVKAEAVETLDDPDVPSQNTQPRERSVKRRRRVYREEDHADVAVSGRKRLTRSSARLSGN